MVASENPISSGYVRFSKLENAYVKTSAFYALGRKRPPYEDLGGMIHKMVAEFGSKRLMWASDCPYQVGEGHTLQRLYRLDSNQATNANVGRST